MAQPHSERVSTVEDVAFYPELTSRNAGVIEAHDQVRLGSATVLVAGCGSIGGAAVEPLARIGVRHFLLADPGEYELNNLNRQNATTADIGQNKAQVAAERIRAINPSATVRVFPDGVNEATVRELAGRCDIVVDGVDVTTMSGLRAKYLLHQHAAMQRLPLFTGWDMAGTQYLRVYDYRTLRRVFDGQLTAADLDRLDMWQILQRLVPARFVPLEMITVARDNIDNPSFAFPQLVYAADLFGAMAARVVAELLAGRPVRNHICIDLHQESRPRMRRALMHARRARAAADLLRQLHRR